MVLEMPLYSVFYTCQTPVKQMILNKKYTLGDILP